MLTQQSVFNEAAAGGAARFYTPKMFHPRRQGAVMSIRRLLTTRRCWPLVRWKDSALWLCADGALFLQKNAVVCEIEARVDTLQRLFSYHQGWRWWSV